MKDGWRRNHTYWLAGTKRAEIKRGNTGFWAFVDGPTGFEVARQHFAYLKWARAWCEAKLAKSEGG